jgi:uncharacterized protein (TIGR03067 family)
MNGIRLLAVPLLVAGIVWAEKEKADDKAAKEELKKLEGTWKGPSAKMGGKSFAPGDIGMEKVRFKGNTMTFLVGKKELATFEIKLDPSKKPKGDKKPFDVKRPENMDTKDKPFGLIVLKREKS